uniref:Uncharacterized protein n=1 Tax=viral metagenome TaxID=1070528 RepID=A0A6H2A0Q0_9ZZZZ
MTKQSNDRLWQDVLAEVRKTLKPRVNKHLTSKEVVNREVRKIKIYEIRLSPTVIRRRTVKIG